MIEYKILEGSNTTHILKHSIKKPVFFMSDRVSVEKRTIFKHDEALYVFSTSIDESVIILIYLLK